MLTPDQWVAVLRTGLHAQVVSVLPEPGLVLVKYHGPCTLETFELGRVDVLKGQTVLVYEAEGDVAPC